MEPHLSRNMIASDTAKLAKIPEGLTPEAAEQFRAVMEENAVLKDQVREIRRTLRVGLVINYRHGKPAKNRKSAEVSTENKWARRSSLKDIRAFCLKCVGGSANGRKPLKAIRQCKVNICPLYPYRMGTNPFQKHDLSEEDRKSRSLAAQERFRNKE